MNPYAMPDVIVLVLLYVTFFFSSKLNMSPGSSASGLYEFCFWTTLLRHAPKETILKMNCTNCKLARGVTHMKSSPSSSSTSSDDSSYFMIGLTLGLSVTVYLQYRRADHLSSSSSHASSLNPSPSSEENPHDVFISFRGEDTRRGFVSHLHDALRRNNIITYRDNSDLERGNKISSTLLRAIEQSKISIIVFSKNYASSSWTKNELVKIMDCQQTRGQVVLPIFYEISPTKVRKKRSYSTIFMFWSSMNETQQQWAKAMEEAAGLAGWDSYNFSTDSELVDVIVSEVKRQLEPLSHSSEGFPSRNGSLDEPNSVGSSHDDPTPEDSEPLSQSSEGLPSRNGPPDEPNSGGSSHDDLTPEDSSPMNCLSHRRRSHERLPDPPLNLNTSWSFSSLHRNRFLAKQEQSWHGRPHNSNN